MTATCVHSFVLKLSADGTRILYGTYLEGSTGSDRASAIAVDSAGNAYIAGTTSSTDFPVSAGAYRATPAESFVAKLNADGSALLGSTYVSGAEPAGIAVDAAGNAFVTGTTTLMGRFAATPGALQTISPGDIDAFVLKLNSSLGTALYSTFLGGTLPDWGYGIAVDAEGNAYVTGTTELDAKSPEGGFPVTGGSYSRRNPGTDAFVSKLSPDGSRLLASSVFGGPDTDVGLAVAVDGRGDVYVGGWTGSSNFLSAGSVGSSYSFALKLSADFANLLYGTSLPGQTNPLGADRFQIALHGDRLVVRHNGKGPLQTTPGAIRPCLAAPHSDSAQMVQSYVIELNATGSAATYATYAHNIYTLTPDSVYVLSSDKNRLLEKTALSVQPAGTVTCIADAATLSEGGMAPGEIVSIFGSGIGPDTARSAELDGTGKVSTLLGGVEVRVNSRPAPLLYASSSQINAVVPFETAGSAGLSIQVLKDSLPLNAITTPAVATSPGVFAILNPNGAINDADHRAGPGSTLVAFLTGAGSMQPSAETGSIGAGNTRIAANVSVTLRAPAGGKTNIIPLEVAYAGDAPNAVQGLVQINLRLPDVLPNTLPSASAFLDFSMGDADVLSVQVWFTP